MKKSSDTHQKALGGEEEQRRATQSGRAEEATKLPRRSVDKVISIYSPLDASAVSLPPPPEYLQQGASPSVAPDGREVHTPGADEEVAGIPPVDGPTDGNSGTVDEKIATYQVRLAPATSPPDASTVSLPLPAYQQGTSPSGPSNKQEVCIPGADEEVPDTPYVDDPTDDSGVCTDQGTSTTQDEVFSAYLVLSPEERRRQLMEQAVSATNVHVIEPRTSYRKWRKPTKVEVALCILVAAVVGITLGVTLGGRKDYTRFDQVASLVGSISNTTNLVDPSSPQYQAAQWMADEDALFEDLATVDPERFRQRYVLALFYFATGGPTSWLNTSFFLKPNIHECEWRDKALPDTQSWSGFVGVFNCSSNGWVERIEINQNNLTGMLPLELGSLSFLSEFTVFQNSIGGTLPRSLFYLSDLQHLTLWSNEFNGTIPTEVGLATSLRYLDFDANSFTGTIPSEIGNLGSLDQLYFDVQFLSGSIPTTLLQLSNILSIGFAQNAFTGTLPQSLWSSWPNLKAFSVWENLLSGTISDNLDSVPDLEALVLQKNNFTGPLPSSIVKLTNVNWFNVDHNDFMGSLPNDWTNLSSTLEWLQVSRNRLTGTLPDSLGSLTNLDLLSLFKNRFNGTIAASLGNLTRLTALHLRNNRLTGTVPTTFVQLWSLQQLTLKRSTITGDLSFLCNGTEMLFPYMHLFHADCLGEFPEVVCPCCNQCCAPNGTCLDV